MNCKICNEEQTLRSMAMHLKWSHSMKTNEYISLYGEFRPKKLNENNLKNSSNIDCKICNENFMHQRQLFYHLTKKHKDTTREEYILKYNYNNIHPLCKCGCGEKTSFIPSGENNDYFTKYIKGHWDWVKPGYFSHTYDNKMKIREARIDILKKGNFFQKVSEVEKELQDFIKQHIDIEINNREILHGCELDIYIPALNIAVEYNGVYFHSDKFKDKNYHIKKTKECNNIGIRLIHVWEGDWRYKKDIVKSNLLNIIGKTPNKIYARKCEIREVENKQCREFLDNNHLQGHNNSRFKYGLYYNNELVSIMTFGSYRKNLGKKSIENEYELLRSCNKINTVVVGGASKIFKHFIKKHNPNKIISYANRDWSMGNMYRKLGFNELEPTSPGYWYYKGRIKYNRFNFRKDILIKQGYDSNKTEFEIMDSLGFLRVWDTGNYKFEWINFLYL